LILRLAKRFPGLWWVPLLLGCRTIPEGPPPRTYDPANPEWSRVADPTLGPNDVLRVVVLHHPELSTVDDGSRVDAQGLLHLPLAGAFDVRGKSVSVLSEEVRSRLTEFVKGPDVTISVVEHGARRFYLLGQVEKPGPQLLDRPLTALQALSYGGRILPGADREEIVLVRNAIQEPTVFAFNVVAPSAEAMIPIRPDDLIFVKRSGTGYFTEELLPILNGLVNATGALGYWGLVYDSLRD
jgi:polysaccharide export outer membrane protein